MQTNLKVEAWSRAWNSLDAVREFSNGRYSEPTTADGFEVGMLRVDRGIYTFDSVCSQATPASPMKRITA